MNDNHDILHALAEALRLEGVQVQTAIGAQMALEAVDGGFAPSVILTDMMMPGLTGEEFIDALRARPHAREIPVVAMSASRRELVRVDGKADQQLEKPFSLETLYATLASMCS